MPTLHPDRFPLCGALEGLVNKRQWRFVVQGSVLTTEEVCASDGMLPALMGAAHDKGLVSGEVFGEVHFRMENEPSSLNCLCGAFVESTPDQSVWLFVLIGYLESLRKSSQEDVVSLDDCWKRWIQRLTQGDMALKVTDPC